MTEKIVRRFVMGRKMIEVLAPIVGLDPGVCRTISVRASYKDVAVFTVELLAVVPPVDIGQPGKGAAL